MGIHLSRWLLSSNSSYCVMTVRQWWRPPGRTKQPREQMEKTRGPMLLQREEGVGKGGDIRLRRGEMHLNLDLWDSASYM